MHAERVQRAKSKYQRKMDEMKNSLVIAALCGIFLSSPGFAAIQHYDIAVMEHEMIAFSGQPIWGGWNQVGTMSLSWNDAQPTTSIPITINIDLTPWIRYQGDIPFVTSATINFVHNGLAAIPDSVSGFAFSGNSTFLSESIPIQNGVANIFSVNGSIDAAAHESTGIRCCGSFVFSDSIAISVPSPIPEPETYTMVLAGLGLLGLSIRRRNKV